HLPPRLTIDGGVLAGRRIHADFARAFDHHPIGADIDATGFRILGYHRVAGAEIHSPVERPHALRGKDADIDVVPLDDVLVADSLIGRNLLRRHFPTQLLLQDLHRLERMIHRLLAYHQAEAREVASNHLLYPPFPRFTFHVLPQHRA